MSYPTTVEAAPPHPIRVISEADYLFDATPDGHWALAQASGGQIFRADLITGQTVPVNATGLSRISDDGSVVWSKDGDRLRKSIVGGGSSTSPNPFAGVLIGGEPWIFTGVSDTAGSNVILWAANGAYGNGEFNYALGGPAPTLLQRPTLPTPVEHDWSIGSTYYSPNGLWVTFWSSSDTVIDGLVGTVQRQFRRHLPSGVTHVINSSTGPESPLWVTNTGRIVIANFTRNGVEVDVWDGPGAAALRLTVDANGSPADAPLTPFSPGNSIKVSDDGTVVAFTSLAGNLDGNRPSGTSRLHVLNLPKLDLSVRPNETYCVPAVGARPGDYVAVNITPVLATARGNGSVHSSDDPAPATANVNFGPGVVDPNVALVKAGADGEICFTNSEHASVHLIIDALVLGDADVFTLPTSSGAARIANTRIGLGGTKLARSATRCVNANGTPGGYTAINITPIDADARGNGSLHSSNDGPPATANVNFGPGTVDPNVAIVQIGTDGKICFTNSEHANVNIILDQLVNADTTAFSLPTANGAVRIANTRTGLGGTKLARSATRCIIANGTPGDYTAINITPIDADARGNGSLHSSNDDPPATANVNFGPDTVDPNVAIAQIGTDGKICFTNSEHANVNIILDQLVNAATTTFTLPTTNGAVRLTDTRVARA